jgi:hypothetical protein
MLEILTLTLMGLGIGDILDGLLNDDDPDEASDDTTDDLPDDEADYDTDEEEDEEEEDDIIRDDAVVTSTDTTVTVTQNTVDASDDNGPDHYVLTEGANIAYDIDDSIEGYVYLVHSGYTDAETVDDIDSLTYGISLDFIVVSDEPMTPTLTSITGDEDGFEYEFDGDVQVIGIVETYSAEATETGDQPYEETLGGFVETDSSQIATYSNQFDSSLSDQYGTGNPPGTPWWEEEVSAANTAAATS